MRLGGAIGRCGIRFGIGRDGRPGRTGPFFFPDLPDLPAERTRMRKLLYVTRDAAMAGRQAQRRVWTDIGGHTGTAGRNSLSGRADHR
jgi:hypothetical protein